MLDVKKLLVPGGVVSLVVLAAVLYNGTNCFKNEPSDEMQIRIQHRDSVITALSKQIDSLGKVKSKIDTVISIQDRTTLKIIHDKQVYTKGLRYVSADSLLNEFKAQLEAAHSDTGKAR